MIFICFGRDSWQCNSDSIHLDFTMLRFNSDSIQHRPDSIQTQFTSASSVSDSTQNSQKMLNWIGIDSESELIHTSLHHTLQPLIWIIWFSGTNKWTQTNKRSKCTRNLFSGSQVETHNRNLIIKLPLSIFCVVVTNCIRVGFDFTCRLLLLNFSRFKPYFPHSRCTSLFLLFQISSNHKTFFCNLNI